MDNQWETRNLSSSHFHSSRNERKKIGGKKEGQGKKNFFQRNTSTKIILIDLLFIIIISGVIVPLIMKREGTSRIDNYKLIYKAFSFDGEVLASLTIIETENVESSELVEVSFYLENEENGTTESDLLPSNNAKRILRTKLNWENNEYIYCNVRINGKNKIIKVRIQ